MQSLATQRHLQVLVPAAFVADCFCESFGASSFAALAGFEAVAGDAAGSCCFFVVFSDVHAVEYGEWCGRRRAGEDPYWGTRS